MTKKITHIDDHQIIKYNKENKTKKGTLKSNYMRTVK